MDVYRPAGNRGAVLRNNRLYMHRWHVTVCCHSYNERKRGPFWRVPLCKPPAHCLAKGVQNEKTPNVLNALVSFLHRGLEDMTVPLMDPSAGEAADRVKSLFAISIERIMYQPPVGRFFYLP